MLYSQHYSEEVISTQVKLDELKSVIREKEALKLQIIETKQEIVALSTQIKAIRFLQRTPISNIGFNFHRGY